ncbi:hypothetical protein GcLGCM259_1255 [Glutamicibacter creatinolyticus]|uniref:DUF1257 domain-containing protein n=1 Tax=Glutamicibacter creatinolyticus TaxID=162496 RepID=A0A5B7WUR7_9MICC|nr:hypothetical protein [Glutamicibacter creatinolyticus]QCY46990.1 hypothetical protein GcLGCM259_1255 [Glutamicibacter creatinolyticus]
MSLEVFLIPAGIMAVKAAQELHNAKNRQYEQAFESTRIQDQQLLIEGLDALGITEHQVQGELVTAQTKAGEAVFVRESDRYLAQIRNEQEATGALVQQLHSAVGQILQRRNVEKVQAQARTMGMRLMEQRAVDGSVQLVFEEA